MNITPEISILTGRGTTALWTLLKALNCSGSYVLLPVNTCEVVVATVLFAGYKTQFHDVDPTTGNGTLKTICDAYTKNVTVLLATHNYGTPLEIVDIQSWAKTKSLFVIEDACNAFGATYAGLPVGSFGDAATFSFGSAKIIDIGAGGGLRAKDPVLLEKCRSYVDSLPVYHSKHKQANIEFQSVIRAIRQNKSAQTPSVFRALYASYLPYLLFRPDEKLKGDIAVGITTLEQNLANRRAKASLWRTELQSAPVRNRPVVAGDAYWRYTFFVPANARDHVLCALREAKVPASKWFPSLHGIFDARISPKSFTGAIAFAASCLNVFVDHTIRSGDIKFSSELIYNTLSTE